MWEEIFSRIGDFGPVKVSGRHTSLGVWPYEKVRRINYSSELDTL